MDHGWDRYNNSFVCCLFLNYLIHCFHNRAIDNTPAFLYRLTILTTCLSVRPSRTMHTLKKMQLETLQSKIFIIIS